MTLAYARVGTRPRPSLGPWALALGVMSLISLSLVPLVGVALAATAIVFSAIAMRRASLEGRDTAELLAIIAFVVAAGGLVLNSLAQIEGRGAVSSRDLSPRAVERANLRGIGQSCYIYASDYDGVFPSKLADLVANNNITPKSLQSPLDRNAADFCDYAYVVGLNPESDPPNWVLAHGDPAYRNGEGAAVLYVDGRVEWVREPKFSEMLAKFKAEYEADRGVPPVIVEPY